MKTIVKGAITDEKGQTLIMVLILLFVGGIIITPLLGLITAGLTAGQVYERKTHELYAADAGVEDAVWKIQNQVDELPYECGDLPWSYDYETSDVNDKHIHVYIDYLSEGNHKITSIATTDNDGGTAAIDSSTTIEAYLSASYMDFSDLLDYAIISNDTIDIQPNNYVDGDVWLPDENNLEIHDPEDILGEVKDQDDVSITWPTAEQLSGYYLDDVDPSNPYPYESIDIKDTKTIGPCYREGSLVVDNTGDPDTLVLEGTVYVTGTLDFEQSGSKTYTVDLNGHTIFAEGSIYFPSQHISVSGSGCIIAVEYVDFNPSIVSAEDDFVLVMSITDIVNFQPSGDFTGCIAGDAHVQLQPGCNITWISPEDKDLDFPGMEDGDELPPITELSIYSWEIK